MEALRKNVHLWRGWLKLCLILLIFFVFWLTQALGQLPVVRQWPMPVFALKKWKTLWVTTVLAVIHMLVFAPSSSHYILVEGQCNSGTVFKLVFLNFNINICFHTLCFKTQQTVQMGYLNLDNCHPKIVKANLCLNWRTLVQTLQWQCNHSSWLLQRSWQLVTRQLICSYI